MAAAAPPLPASPSRMAPPAPPDLTAFATQSVTVSDSGGSENDLSFASLVSVASLEANIEGEEDAPAVVEPRPGAVTRGSHGAPKRRYDESESSTDVAAAPKKAKVKDEPKRRGKWTAPEEAYANVIIDLFVAGKFPGCSGGESLRALLSKLLLCTPMRITKKFSRTRLIGKSSYKRAGEASPDEIATLEGARRAFRRHAELPEESEGERPPVQLDAWVTTQGFDPSEMGGGNLEHSLRGGGLSMSNQAPSVTPRAESSASWSLFNQQQQQTRAPAAVRAHVCGYTKDRKTFVRVVARNDADFLLVLAQQLALHGAVVANLRFNAESGVAWARVEVRAADEAPLAQDKLKALEASFLTALRKKNTEADASRSSSLPEPPRPVFRAPPPPPPFRAPPPVQYAPPPPPQAPLGAALAAPHPAFSQQPAAAPGAFTLPANVPRQRPYCASSTDWRNGSASDSSPEGYAFESRIGHLMHVSSLTTVHPQASFRPLSAEEQRAVLAPHYGL